VLIKLLQPVGAARRLLADLVEAHAAAEEAGAPGEGSEADSEAALATARTTLAAAGVAGEGGGPVVPRLDLHKVRPGGPGVAAVMGRWTTTDCNCTLHSIHEAAAHT
jgi:hypothetical protein